ncbi:hypothetical protein [Deinococcus altitudinis]|uniref:hypothetical protein n=1 Tax=Deinococcus altitudinis TaxID=468914 RepID=UPI0038927CBD
MPRLLSWPLLLGVVIVAQIPEIIWLLERGWWVPTLGATAAGAALGWQLRPEVSRRTWLLLAITVGIWVVQQVIPDGAPSRLIDQMYTALLIAALWPQEPTDRFRRRAKGLLKQFRRWSTGIPLPNSSALNR